MALAGRGIESIYSRYNEEESNYWEDRGAR